MLSLAFVIAAFTPWTENKEVAVRLVSEVSALAPGETTIAVGVEMKVAPHWHVYWKNSGDAGFAPALKVPARSDVQTAELEWPRPQRFVLKSGLVAYGYEDHVIYPATLTLRRAAEAGRTNDVRVTIDFLVCDDECVPYVQDLALALPTNGLTIDPEASAALTEARALVPVALQQRVRAELEGETLHTYLRAESGEIFFDVHPDVELGASTATREDGVMHFRTRVTAKKKDAPLSPLTVRATFTNVGGRHYEATITAETKSAPAAGSLPFMLLLALLGGVILNLMPCVLPVLSLKLLGLIGHEAQARRGALWSVAGIVTSFAALAAFVLALRGAGAAAGWGVQFQEPVFVTFLAIVVTLFALNLWGVFEVPLPAVFARAGAASTDRSALSSFTAGFFATLLATPCSAPFLGTAVAFALAEPPLTVVTIFFAIGVGMSAPYLLLAVRPSLVRVLPRPGAWMVRLKQALGFVLAATAVWLVFVLAGQVSQVETALVQLSLVVLAALAWGYEALGERAWLRRVTVLAMVASSVLILLHVRGGAPSEGLRWEPFDAARFDALEREGKPVFVDVTADWCFTCKVNERVVLAAPEVRAALGKRGAVLLRADWTKRDAGIAAFLADHGRSGIPFYLWQPERGAAKVLPELLTERAVIEAIAE